jgi:hypothetical protein
MPEVAPDVDRMRRAGAGRGLGVDLDQRRAGIRADAGKDKIRIATRSGGSRAFAFRLPHTPDADARFDPDVISDGEALAEPCEPTPPSP